MVGLKNERKGNLEHEIRYHKFVISREATGLLLIFPFTFFSMKALHSFDTNKMLTREK